MGIFSPVITVFLALASFANGSDLYSRKDFPDGFVFGAATSAYQWEGAVNEDGRTPSVWDTYLHRDDRANADIASDGYHKYEGDVKLMADMGLDAFRFSISWSRLLPSGREPINPRGLQFYRNLINELLKHGIEPHITLYHYDFPQVLEDEYGGWFSHKVIKDFTAYADVCFREFGDKVKFWTTINEPNLIAMADPSIGVPLPGHCTGLDCSGVNSSTISYIVAHNLLLAHASAARLYKNKYMDKQQGSIGITLFSPGLIPFTNSQEDEIATQRARDFYMGWMIHPLVYGDYPKVMKELVGSRLPAFSDAESKLVKGAFDFLGVIHYWSFYIKDDPSPPKQRSYLADMRAKSLFMENFSFTEPFPVEPGGIAGVLDYIKQTYGNPPIYILENGDQTRHNSSLNDTVRVEYLHAYMGTVLDAVRNGSDTRGYFVWSMVDLYEFLSGGYNYSFGLYYVDVESPDLKRYPKFSSHWYSAFLKGTPVSSHSIPLLQHNFSVPAYGVSSQ